MNDLWKIISLFSDRLLMSVGCHLNPSCSEWPACILILAAVSSNIHLMAVSGPGSAPYTGI